MATLPPVNLGAILFLSFLAVLALRKPIENRFVLSAAKTSQPEHQFLMDLGLCLTAGILAMAFNIAAFGFPIASGIKLMIGCAVAGFFLSLDTALARERIAIKNSIAGNQVLPPPGRLYSMTKKFSLVALATTIFVSIVIILVFTRDIVWLSKMEQNEAALLQAQLSVAYEVSFVFMVLLALVVNLIISYSRNLKLLFANETRNDAGEMFGFNRLHQVIFNNVAESAEAIQNAVIDALLSFKGNATQEDDITLVIIKFL